MQAPSERAAREIAVAAGDDDVPAQELRGAVEALLGRLLPADDLFLCRLDLAAGTATATRRGVADTGLGAALLAACADHPAVLSYLHAPGDLRPRRVSDVADDRTWRRSRSYRDLFAARGGRFQLSVLSGLSGTVGQGWIATRASVDFTDRELDLAVGLAPLARLVGRANLVPVADSGLTRRETAVLDLVAEGLTAEAIAHTLGIAAGTVRKHLEHVYEKLGAHDRLLAVDRARRLGLLPPR